MSDTAIATGAVAASTAAGSAEANMLDTATTNSMTNRLNVPELSSTPTGWIRLNIQASPKNRSSSTKRRRQRRMSAVSAAVARNRRQASRMTMWISSIPAVQVPAVRAPVQSPDRTPIEPIRIKMTREPDSRFWANCRSNSYSKAERVPVVEVSRSRASRTRSMAARRRVEAAFSAGEAPSLAPLIGIVMAERCTRKLRRQIRSQTLRSALSAGKE